MKKIGSLLIAACLCLTALAQNSVDIYATGALGSFTTGKSSNTVRTDNNLVVQSFVTRGYAVFDLASLPATAVITSVELHYNVAVLTMGTGSGHQTRGYVGDLSTITVAGTLYTAMGAAPIIYPSTGGYGTLGNHNLPTDPLAVNFVQTNIGGKVSIVFATVGPATYTITGETGAATPTGTHAPYIRVNYTCPDITSITATPPSPNPCPNIAFSLTGSATGSIAGYSWTGPAGFSSTMASPTISAGLATSNTYSLTVTDINGCTAKATAAVIVFPAPNTTISPVTLTAFCAGDNATLDAPGAVGGTVQWYDNGVAIPGATDQTYVASATGNFKVEITDGNGCVGMTATAVPVVMLDNPAVSPAGPVLLCQGDNGTIMVNTNGVTTGLAFQWQKDGVNIPGSVSNAHIATTSGVYKCLVSVTTSTCTTTSQEVTVDVNDYPLPVVAMTGTKLSTSNVYGAYQWFLNTIAIPGATNYTVTPTTTGSYRVRVTDINGCTAFSNGFPVNAVSAVGGMAANGIRLYPNPVTSIMRIESPEPVQVILSSIEGKVLGTSNYGSELDIANLPAGLYLVSVYNRQGERIMVEKVTKQ